MGSLPGVPSSGRRSTDVAQPRGRAVTLRIFVHRATATPRITSEIVDAAAVSTVGSPQEADVVLVDADEASAAVRMARERSSAPILAVESDSSEWSDADDVIVAPIRPAELSQRLHRLAAHRETADTVERARLLSVAVEVAEDIIEIADPSHRIEYVNPAFEQLLGRPASEVLGQRSEHVWRSQLQDEAYHEAIRAQLASGLSWSGLIYAKTQDGKVLQLDSTVTPVYGADSSISHYVALRRDVTAHVSAEAKLRQLNAELEQARDTALESSRAKTQFVANVSHELRTPLNAIIGYAELRLEDAQEASDRAATQDLERLLTAARQLGALIENVLELSSLDAGTGRLKTETFNVAQLVRQAVASLQPLALNRGNEIVVRSELEDDSITADRGKLQQVLLNVIANANKFTDHGPILVRVHPVQVEAVAIAVSDTGIGMDASQISRVLRPFVQGDDSSTRRYGGAGLGLAIAHRYCRLMQGQLDITSAVGQGSTVTVVLPCRPRPSELA